MAVRTQPHAVLDVVVEPLALVFPGFFGELAKKLGWNGKTKAAVCRFHQFGLSVRKKAVRTGPPG
jgi:hypothetical protein